MMNSIDGEGARAADSLPDPFVPQLYDAESPAALKRSMSWWLIGMGRLWRNLLDDRLRAAGQTQPRWRALAWARMLPGIRQADLAERMDISRPTLVRLLDSLEEQGLIERRANASDRRANGIYLTSNAEPLVRQIEEEVRSIGDYILQDLSPQEMAQCLDLLRRIRLRVNEISRTTRGFPLPPKQ